MRRFGEILRSVPQEDIEKAYRKKREAWKLCSNIDDIRRIYKELIKVNICNSNRILQIYPSSDPVVMEDINGNPALESPDCVRLINMREIKEIYQKYGASHWQKKIDEYLMQIEHLLEHPEEISNKKITMLWQADFQPREDIFDSIQWEEIPGLQVYGHDVPSERDAELIATVLDDISAYGSSKEEFIENYLLVNGDDDEEEIDLDEYDEDEENFENMPERLITDPDEKEFAIDLLKDARNELRALGVLLEELYGKELAKPRNAMLH